MVQLYSKVPVLVFQPRDALFEPPNRSRKFEFPFVALFELLLCGV